MFRHERATTSCGLEWKAVFLVGRMRNHLRRFAAWLMPCLPRSRSESTIESKSKSKATDSSVRPTRSKSRLPNSLGRGRPERADYIIGLQGQREGKTRPGDFLTIMATSGRG